MASSKDDVTIAELRSLVALYDLVATHQPLSMEQAARGVGRKGQTVRNRISDLNEAFGRLVESSPGKPPKLTERGRAAERLVRQIVRAYDDLVDLRTRERQQLRIGCNRLVWPLVVQLLKEHRAGELSIADADGKPFEVTLHLVDHTQQMVQLLDGHLHVAIGYESDELNKKSHYNDQVLRDQLFKATELLEHIPCGLVVPSAAAANGQHVRAALAGLTYMILPDRRIPDFHRDAERWLERECIRPGRRIETDRALEIASAAETGSGFGFLPLLWRGVYEGQAEFIPVPSLTLGPRLVMYEDRSHPPPYAMHEFVSRLRRLIELRTKE